MKYALALFVALAFTACSTVCPVLVQGFPGCAEHQQPGPAGP